MSIQEHHLARQDSARGAAAAKAASSEFLTLRLGAEQYGVDILRVQEICSHEEPTRIAHAPSFSTRPANTLIFRALPSIS